MSIAHLPLELTLDIINYLSPHVPLIDSNEALTKSPQILTRWLDDEDSDGLLRGSTPMMPHHGRYSDLKSLRLTSRYLDELCTPLIYVELDILPQRATISNTSAILSRYPEHVRYLRIGVTRAHTFNEEYDRLIIEALRVCKHTTSLVIYFEEEGGHGDQIPPEYEPFMRQLGGEASALVMRGGVSSLGAHSVDVERNGQGWGASPIGLTILLQSIFPVLDGRSAIRRLVIATSCITPDIYDNIQSTAASIQSITFKVCFSTDHDGAIPIKVWMPERAAKWSHNTDLTHLRLINCGNTSAYHIPELVRHFSSLKYLFVTACGDDRVVAPPRRLGWSREPDALCNQRPPLEVFHIEHMLEWEIVAMGIIPSKTLVVTSLYSGDLERAFIADRELFPCLDLLRIEGKRTKGGRGLPVAGELDRDLWQRKLSEERGILVQEDAEYLLNRRWFHY